MGLPNILQKQFHKSSSLDLNFVCLNCDVNVKDFGRGNWVYMHRNDKLRLSAEGRLGGCISLYILIEIVDDSMSRVINLLGI